MHHKKNKQFALRRLALTVILLLACFILMVGVTWARYQAEENSVLYYTPKVPGTISLQADNGWSFSDGLGTLSFQIRNSTDESDFAADTQKVSVRLLGSLTIAKIEDATVQLFVSDGTSTTTYTAVSVPIAEESPLFKTFGPGLVYVFQDEKGNEMSWLLEGGKSSVLSGKLVTVGLSEPAEPALLQLQVVGK